MQIEGITGEPFTSDKYDGTPVPRRIEIEGQPILIGAPVLIGAPGEAAALLR